MLRLIHACTSYFAPSLPRQSGPKKLRWRSTQVATAVGSVEVGTLCKSPGPYVILVMWPD